MLLNSTFLHHDPKILLWGNNTEELTFDLLPKAYKVEK